MPPSILYYGELESRNLSPPKGAEGGTHAWPRPRLITGFGGGGGERPIRVRTVERHAVPRAPPPQFEDQLNTPQRKALLSPRESLICKGYSPCCCRGTTQRTRRIAKWKELQLKRLLNDQQLCADATAGVRRKQGKMLATNKQETSCWYVHVHTLFRCVF